MLHLSDRWPTLLLEGKLNLVTMSPTTVAMKLFELRFRFGLGLLTWFLLTKLLTLFPKEHIHQVALELYGFVEIICGVREYGWMELCQVCLSIGLA
jgi:hypothetical protein